MEERTQVESGEHGGNKKPRLLVRSGMLGVHCVQVKKETPPERETGRAIVVATTAAAPPPPPPVAKVAVEFDKLLLDCPLCYLPLKPPTFQCRAKHTACRSCAANLNSKCPTCVGGGAYERNDGLDPYLLGAKVRCPYEAYGCQSSVAYCLVGDHQLACPHAPCGCPEHGCPFLGSPPALRDHLVSQHAWAVTTIPFSKARRIEMPAADRRRLVATEDGEHVFLLVVSEGGGGGRQVRLVRIRASNDAGPTGYWCMLWFIPPVDPENGGKTPAQMLEERARCCAALTEEAAMELGGRYLPVQPYDMHPGCILVLRLRIDKYQLQTAAAAAYPVLGGTH